MKKTKRVVISTVLGIVFGFISWAICNFMMGHDQPNSVNSVIILTNALLGFTIGISSLRWHWVFHGLILGGLFGLVMALIALSHGDEFIWPLVLGFVYGFLIELITTVGFKAGITT